MQGSEDEDMATKAFNALKEVSSARRRRLAPRGLPGTPVCLQGSLSLQTPSSPSGSLRLGWGSLGALRVTPPWSPQLVQECNASVQSMKRTEELIHLSKKIHFEGKVSAFSQGAGTPGGGQPCRLLPGAAGQSVAVQPSTPCPLPPALPRPPPPSQIFPLISQARWLVRHGELVELAPLPAVPPAKLKLSSKAVYLHLFNDCLLLSRRKE